MRATGVDEGVIKVGVGGGDAAEDEQTYGSDWGGEMGEERNEAGDKEVLLLGAAVDDVGVSLLERDESGAVGEESWR